MHSNNESQKPTEQKVLYLGQDESLARRLDPLLQRRRMGLVHATTSRSSRELVAGCDLLLIDAAALSPGEPLKDLTQDLREAAGQAIPLVVITEGRSIEARLDALRADAAACVTAPVVPSELAERLAQVSRPIGKVPARVLVVEDSATQAIMIERILKGAGFSTRILNNSLGVIEALDDFRPDLVLMDLHMPGATGAELAAIIREQDGFAATPIVFLSNERDQEVQVQALSMGGDAFITKPIEAELLIKVLTQRIASMRALRERIDVADHRDPDTGLASRRYFMSRLERAMGEPDIEEHGNGVLMLALDEINRLTETLGAAGTCLVHDRVGTLVQGRLGAGDLGTRLDDRHIVIIAQRAGDSDLVAFGEELRHAIEAYPLVIGGKTLSVTASVGIGTFRPSVDDAVQLIGRAGEACAEALTGGGNQVVFHSPETFDEAEQAREDHMANVIRRALDSPGGKPGIELFYQPIVAVKPGSRHYLEVLPVLNVGRVETIAADEFLPVAERSGQIAAVDRLIMARALAALSEQAQAQPRLRMLVPQHVAAIANRDWVHWVRGQISAHGLGQRRPIVEIGIADVLKQRQVAPLPLKMLHKIGLKVCLTGVEHNPVSLDLVTDLQPQFVKLAPEVTRDIKPDRLNRLVEQLKGAGPQIIACGIDAPDQIAPIWASGIHYAQGALIQEPLAEPVTA